MADHASAFYMGRRVSYNSGSRCTVKYLGPLSGRGDSWVGVEWDDHTLGKNDGSYEGVRYFTCMSLEPLGIILQLNHFDKVKTQVRLLAASSGHKEGSMKTLPF